MRNISILIIFAIISLYSCKEKKYLPVYNFDYTQVSHTDIAYPPALFMVFSDPHTYNNALGTNGTAFEEYLKHDRKMLIESERILQKAVEYISQSTAQFVIVPGDLTKDGSTQSHRLFASYLKKIEQSGKQVFVVPGNHDMVNPHAVRFISNRTIPVDRVDQESFKDIYHSFGYQESLYQDDHSVSYVAEPVPGLWLLALDSTITSNNIEENYPHTDGEFNHKTAVWIERMLTLAQKQGKSIIAFFHHGLVPHWNGQEKLHDEYVLNAYQQFQKLFIHYGVKTVFTGHYHAQDVSRTASENGQALYDIQTGSLVTYPCPVRIIEITAENKMKVSSHYISSINHFAGDFSEFSRHTAYHGVFTIAKNTVMGYNVQEKKAEYFAHKVAKAYLSHYHGDERPGSEDPVFQKSGMGIMGRMVINNQSYVLKGLWTDSESSDNKILIDLTTGNWTNQF